jgi:hypothetical protein
VRFLNCVFAAFSVYLLSGCANAQTLCYGINCDINSETFDPDALYNSYRQLGAMSSLIDSQNIRQMFGDGDDVKQCLLECQDEYTADMNFCRSAFGSGYDSQDDSTAFWASASALASCYEAAERLRSKCFSPVSFEDCLK